MSDDRYVRQPHVLSRRTLDAVVVLAEPAADAVVVSGCGPDVWWLLQEPRTVDELGEHLTGVPRDAITEALALLTAGRAVSKLDER